MRKIFFNSVLVILLLILASSCEKKERDMSVATISGKVSEGIKKVSLMQRKGMTSILDQVDVDSSGSFTIKYKGERASHLMLNFGHETADIDIYAERGDIIEIDYQNEEAKIEGDKKSINDFLQQFKGKYIEMQKNLPSMSDELCFRKNVEKAAKDLIAFVEQGKGLSDEFIKVQKAWIELDMLSLLVTLPHNRKIFERNDKPVVDSYWSFLDGVKFDNSFYPLVSFSERVVSQVLEVQEQYRGVSQGDGLYDYLKVRSLRISNPTLREDYILQALQIEMHSFNQNLPEMIQSVEAMVTTEEGKNLMTYYKETNAKQREEHLTLLKGALAPEISGEDRHGKKLRLSDLKGNVVVIDVWGTSCIPCIAEIPYVKQLEHHYADKPVKFVSIAMDNDKEIWIKFMERKDMEGIQLVELEGFKGDFRKRYSIRSIPRFIVIDQDGKIVEAFAPRPSSPRLKMMIDGLL